MEPNPGSFPDTNTKLIEELSNSHDSIQFAAFESFATNYWSPLFYFAVRKSYSTEDAKDAVQGFFAKLIERGGFTGFDRRKGKLRTYLLTQFQRYLIDEYRKNEVRGGNQPHFAIHENDHSEFILEENSDLSPEAAYDQRWAIQIASRAIKNMAKAHQKRGSSDRFETVKHYLFSRAESGSIKKAAKKLGISESAFNAILHRERKRFGTEFEKLIEETLGVDENAHDECRYLLSLIGIFF